jgi:manganese oxidase
LARDKQKVYSDPTSQPLAPRVNVGDCAKITLTNEIPGATTFDGWSKTTIHIHHVQFDVQGFDGVSTGFAYEHSVRPYAVEDSARDWSRPSRPPPGAATNYAPAKCGTRTR